MSDLTANPDKGSPDKRVWLGKLATYLASAAAGMAINDLSGTLGYHGLAGAFAFFGVIFAANWIRTLDSRARLARLAPWLFLAPAACLAIVAAFWSGRAAGILAAIAAMLTLGAVLITKELQTIGRLLAGIALIVGGVAVIAAGATSFVGGNTSLGTMVVLGGIALVIGGVGHISDRDKLAGTALMVAGAAVILAGILVIETRAKVSPANERTIGIAGVFWFGLGLLGSGRVLISGGAKGLIVSYPEIFHPLDLKWYTVSAKSASASAGAVLIAVILRGASATLAWAGIIVYFLAVAVLVIALIGPRFISRRVQGVIDWLIKPPHEEPRESDIATPAGDSAK